MTDYRTILMRTGLALVWAILVCLAPSKGAAQSAPVPVEQEPRVSGEGEPSIERAPDPDELRVERVREVEADEVERRVRAYIESSDSSVTIYQIVEEMIDDFVADIDELNQGVLSPVAIRGIGMTPNLSEPFGLWVESELINALSKHSDMRVKRCISCHALRTRMEGEDWIVSRGFVDQSELAAEAKRLGVSAYLDAFVAYVPGANVVSLNIQIFRATDGKVLWTESYRSDATTAAILRSGDRVLTRDEARAELVRKLEERPYYGYQVLAGGGFIPYDNPAVGALGGLVIGGRIYEEFGAQRRLLYGVQVEGFINRSEAAPLSGAFVGATAQYQLNVPNLNQPIYRAGGAVQGFIAGNEGNSFLFEGLIEAIFQFRFGASLGVFYFVPTTFAGFDLGGAGLKARFLINF